MAGSQFDPQVVVAFIAEITERAASAPDPAVADAPVQALADRVRTLLESAKLGPCHPSPAASTAGVRAWTPRASRRAST